MNFGNFLSEPHNCPLAGWCRARGAAVRKHSMTNAWETKHLFRPIELKVVRLFVDPGFVEFSDWSFEPRLILRVLRADVRYLNKPRKDLSESPQNDRRFGTRKGRKPVVFALSTLRRQPKNNDMYAE